LKQVLNVFNKPYGYEVKAIFLQRLKKLIINNSK
jgi:hypothetical protein